MEKYFDITYIWNALPVLLPFLKITFMVAGLSIIFGTFFGLILAMMKLGKSRIAQKIANFYITILRCTPSIVLLFLVYYGVPALADNFGLYLHDLNTAVFVVITFTLQFAAIMAEVIRSAYESIEKGQGNDYKYCCI